MNVKKNERGQTLILIALTLTLLLAMLGLLLDGGLALVFRRKMQNAADAAAKAGVRELALGNNDATILSRTQEYAVTRNGAMEIRARYYPGGEDIGRGGVPETATGVAVTTTLEFPTLFAGIVGLNEMTASASAEARFGAVRSASFLAPVAIHCDPSETADDDECPPGGFNYGSSYQLWGEKSGPGSFHWLDWSGAPVSNPELVDNLNNHQYSGTWQVGDRVPAGPGVQNSGPVTAALDQWLAKDEDERHWTVIVYDYVEDTGSNLEYHIYSFAEFILTGYNFNGNPKFIQGKFMRWTEPNKNIDLDNRGTGVTGIRITR
jgi:hypothetical protein